MVSIQRASAGLVVCVGLVSCGPQGAECGTGVAEVGKICMVPGPDIQSVAFSRPTFADLDGDGLWDMVDGFRGETPSIHLNQGGGVLVYWGVVEGKYQEGLYVSRDIDRNGRAELVRFADDSLTVDVIEIQGEGLLVTRTVPSDVAGSVLEDRWNAHGDFDRDGLTDFAERDAFFPVMLARGGGEYEGMHLDPEREIVLGRNLLAGDLNGDGNDELVFQGGADIEVWSGDRLRTHVVYDPGFKPNPPWELALVTVEEGAGQAFLAWAPAYDVTRVEAFSIRPEDGAARWSLDLGVEADYVFVADLDGNGLDDLLISDHSRSRVLISLPGAPFGEEVDAPFLRRHYDPPWWFTVAHLNDDGLLDLVFAWDHPMGTLLSNP